MKLKYLLLALLPFSLAACQSTQTPSNLDQAVNVQSIPDQNKTLAAYEWISTTSTTPKPLTLSFNTQGQLSVKTSCNGLGTSWKIEGDKIVTGAMMGTQMACAEPAMQQERLAADLLGQRSIQFTLNSQNVEAPTLTLLSAKGEKYVFVVKMTPETKYQSQGETIFLEISPETKTCSAGVARIECLQVREIKYDDKGLKTTVDKDWTLFYDHIEGYTHDSKTRQIVRVKRFERQNPAADQSKYAYVKDMVIETETVK